MSKKSTIDHIEVTKFDNHASDWWNPSGPLKTLHHINPTRVAYIQQHIDLRGLTVLDVGCGGGILSEDMAKLGAEVTGIDASKEAIHTARKHAADSKLNIHYECQLVEDFEHSEFDVVTCMELLEHVKNPELLIEHSVRLLKPGGFLFLSTISRTLKAYVGAVLAAEYILRLLPKQTHEYSKFLKPSELAHSARHLGLEFIDMKGLDYNPFTRNAKLVRDVSINYLILFKKPKVS